MSDHIDRHVEREEDRLAQDHAEGRISDAEYNRQVRELHRDASDAVQAELDERIEAIREEYRW